MMPQAELDYSLDLNNVLKQVKEEIEETDLLAQPCEEQDFKMSEIKSEKIDENESVLNTQQSENFAETSNVKLEHQKQFRMPVLITKTHKLFGLAVKEYNPTFCCQCLNESVSEKYCKERKFEG
uniref:Uncharacterized protein n=1 Tax=Biomphalaria glabrata TaxID=6526 RepID=A0A2C9KEM7_BIOGL